MMKRKNATLPIGILVQNVDADEELARDLLQWAKRLKLTRTERFSVKWVEASLEGENGSVPIGHSIAALENVLQAHCPPYFVLELDLGKGLAARVALDGDALGADRDDGVVWKDPGDGSGMPRGASYRLVVSDHGNLSLYTRRGREVWAVV